MNISIIGTSYVGLVTGACFADFGLSVTCVDQDETKISLLNSGGVPIYEPNLTPLIKKNVSAGRLIFTTDLQVPPSLRATEGNAAIPPSSPSPLRGEGRVRVKHPFDLVSNPEFLREGSAVYDFTHPDKIVIGCENDKAKQIMQEIYRPLYLIDTPFIFTTPETAELIKYACNAFLATKITFINEIANLCDKVGADVHQIAKAMGLDGRISPKFLHPGPGIGGSCFPKDTEALCSIATSFGGNNEMRNIDIVKIIISTLRKFTKDDAISEDLITYVEDRKGYDWRYAIDSSLLKKELGWQPNMKFKDEIGLTINWYLENLNWMKEITSGEYKNYYCKFYRNRKLINGE